MESRFERNGFFNPNLYETKAIIDRKAICEVNNKQRFVCEIMDHYSPDGKKHDFTIKSLYPIYEVNSYGWQFKPVHSPTV